MPTAGHRLQAVLFGVYGGGAPHWKKSSICCLAVQAQPRPLSDMALHGAEVMSPYMEGHVLVLSGDNVLVANKNHVQSLINRNVPLVSQNNVLHF